ncbi:unnamed protein product [Gongylonema pulchrum]|uniref:Methyltransferase n=1 Tax=Gongylonema pulchrum TaxID=637853 RepID=A0A183ECS7_9BILA|nr:unnamed protein product [Gongylonema pulchrum]
MKVLRLSYISCRFRAGQRTELGLSTIGDSRTAHVISANVGTGSRSVLRLKDVNAKNMRFKYGGVLPEKAILGLWNALKSCSLIPKMIQLEADQMKEKLSQRQFPASPEEVQEARLKIREALEAESGLPAQNAVNQKVVIKNMRFKYGGVLPEKAILGLWNALKSCSLIPKMIQLEADQEKLSQRQFPASPEEVQEARLKIREALEAESGLPAQNAVNQKVEEAYERELKKKVDKMLRHTRYNWKPLDFKTREQAAAYTLARIAPNHAEVRFVLQELERVKYVPQTVLDYGSGSGAAFWAAFEQWGKKVASYQLIDPNEEISQFCMDILRGDGENDGHAFVHPDITFRRFLAPSLSNIFDVIIVHRVLAEVASKESRIDLITNLWRRTNRLKQFYWKILCIRCFLIYFRLKLLRLCGNQSFQNSLIYFKIS